MLIKVRIGVVQYSIGQLSHTKSNMTMIGKVS